MVSPATSILWQSQSDPAVKDPRNPTWGNDYESNDCTCETSGLRRSDVLFGPCFSNKKYNSSSPFREVPEEPNARPPDCGGKPTYEKPVSGFCKNKGQVDEGDNNEALKIVSNKSIFFSKYFPGELGVSTCSHQHWKKIISQMNANKTSGPPSNDDDSSYRDDKLGGGQPRAIPGLALSHDLILQNCHTTTRDDNADRFKYRVHNVGLSLMSENCSPVAARDGDDDMGRGCGNKDKDMPWSLQSRDAECRTDAPGRIESGAASDGIVHSGSHQTAAVTRSAGKRGPEVPHSATATTTVDDHSPSRAGWDRLEFQPPPPCPEADGPPAPLRYSPCSSSDHLQGSTETVPLSVVSGDSGGGDSRQEVCVETPHSTQTQQQQQPGGGVGGGGGKASQPDSGLCQVCQDIAAGFYCGAFVCEACKKFFIRASKQDKEKFVCLRESMCKITKESRVQCQYCRFQKCLSLNMYYPGEGKRSMSSIHVSGIPCRVCGSPSSGFHFGALTCEGCKGFFRRMVKERDPGMYKCSTGGSCEISVHTRNMCKACRYQKCLENGMSVEGSRIGRQPNAVKHAISLEVKKQRLEQPLPPKRRHQQQQHQQQQQDSQPGGNDRPFMSSATAAGTGGGGGVAQVSTSLGVKKEAVSRTVDGGRRAQGGVRAGAGSTSRRCSLSSSCGATTTASSGLGAPSAGVEVEVKEEPDSPLELSDVVLTQVNPEVVVKQPPEIGFEEKDMKMAFSYPDNELTNMVGMNRAKLDTLDISEFESYPMMWKKQMKHFDFHAQCLIRFSKKVPGFKDILLDDKVALVQSAIYPVVVLNHSRTYELSTGFYNFFNFTKPEEQVILDMCPSYTTLQSHFRHMGALAQTMSMTHMEFTLLSCLLLCDPECPNLKEPERVEELQTRFMNFLQSYEIETHPSRPTRFGELLLRISELKLASEQHIQTLQHFLFHHPELELPQMFKEMFF